MAELTQSRKTGLGIGTLPSSSTSTGTTTQLDPLTGLYVTPGLSVQHYGSNSLITAKFTLNGVPVSVADDSGTAQYGGTKLYNFPEGLILVLGCTASVVYTPASSSGTIIATFDGDMSIGSAVATTGATLVSTEADIMISNALTTAVGGVSTSTGVSSATQVTESAAVWLNGTSAAKSAFLNFVIDDDASHTAAVGDVDGTVYITYVVLGDV